MDAGGAQEAQASRVSSGAMDRTFEPKPVKNSCFAQVILSNPVFDRMNQMRELPHRKQNRLSSAATGSSVSAAARTTVWTNPRRCPSTTCSGRGRGIMQHGCKKLHQQTYENGVAGIVIKAYEDGQVPERRPLKNFLKCCYSMDAQAGVATICGGRGVISRRR